MNIYLGVYLFRYHSGEQGESTLTNTLQKEKPYFSLTRREHFMWGMRFLRNR